MDENTNGDAGAVITWSLEIKLGPETDGSLNFDGNVDVWDIDLAYANLGSNDATYDLNGDGNVDQSDVDELVLEIIGTRYGDVDLDLDVDIVDFNALVMNFDPTAENGFHGWSVGNFDGDSDIDITDILRVTLNYAPLGYTLSATSDVASMSRFNTPAQPSLSGSARQRSAAAQIFAAESVDHATHTARRSSPTRSAGGNAGRLDIREAVLPRRHAEFSVVDVTFEAIGRRRVFRSPVRGSHLASLMESRSW